MNGFSMSIWTIKQVLILLIPLNTLQINGFENLPALLDNSLWNSNDKRKDHFARSISMDLGQYDSKPQLSASHDTDFTQIKCTVMRQMPDSEIYLNCPALGHQSMHRICYQGCQPTNRCSKSLSQTDCVPHEQTVFCDQQKFPNGTIIIQIKVDRSDKRLAGVWSCAHAGMESTKFEINSEPKNLPEPARTPVPNEPVKTAPNPLRTVKNDYESYLDERPLAYLRKPELVFTILAVFVISLLINLGFCIRCLLMRSYIDASNEGSEQATCLAYCLCLPKELRSNAKVAMSPMLARCSTTSPQLSHSMKNHSDSAMLMNSTFTMQRMPLLYNSPTSPDRNDMACISAGSLPGTFRHYDGVNLYGVHQPTLPTGVTLATDSGGLVPVQLAQFNLEDAHKIINLTPSYVRAPSLNTPSPKISQKFAKTNNGSLSSQTGFAVVANSNGPSNLQYAPHYRYHPQQVIYDDVAAGTSSIVVPYGQNPHWGILDTNNMSNQNIPMQQLQPNFNTLGTVAIGPDNNSTGIYFPAAQKLSSNAEMNGAGSSVPGNFSSVPLPTTTNPNPISQPIRTSMPFADQPSFTLSRPNNNTNPGVLPQESKVNAQSGADKSNESMLRSDDSQRPSTNEDEINGLYQTTPNSQQLEQSKDLLHKADSLIKEAGSLLKH